MTILAGTDRSQTALGADRADFIGNVSQYGQLAPTGSRSGCGSAACVPWLNTSLFALPAIGTFGNIGKGAFRGPGRTNIDTGLLKNFFPLKSHEDIRLQLRGEFFNVLNHAQFNDPDVTRNDGNFGGIYAAADPRIIQLAVKVFFEQPAAGKARVTPAALPYRAVPAHNIGMVLTRYCVHCASGWNRNRSLNPDRLSLCAPPHWFPAFHRR